MILVEIAVAAMKKEKSVGVDNFTSRIQASGETMINVLTKFCNKIWRTGDLQTPWTESLIITLSRKGSPASSVIRVKSC